jgi:hypothetical protein
MFVHLDGRMRDARRAGIGSAGSCRVGSAAQGCVRSRAGWGDGRARERFGVLTIGWGDCERARARRRDCYSGTLYTLHLRRQWGGADLVVRASRRDVRCADHGSETANPQTAISDAVRDCGAWAWSCGCLLGSQQGWVYAVCFRVCPGVPVCWFLFRRACRSTRTAGPRPPHPSFAPCRGPCTRTHVPTPTLVPTHPRPHTHGSGPTRACVKGRTRPVQQTADNDAAVEGRYAAA